MNIYKRKDLLWNEEEIIKQAELEFVTNAEETSEISKVILETEGIEGTIRLINEYSDNKVQTIENSVEYTFDKFNDSDSFFNFLTDTKVDYVVKKFNIGNLDNHFRDSYILSFENEKELNKVLKDANFSLM